MYLNNFNNQYEIFQIDIKKFDNIKNKFFFKNLNRVLFFKTFSLMKNNYGNLYRNSIIITRTYYDIKFILHLIFLTYVVKMLNLYKLLVLIFFK